MNKIFYVLIQGLSRNKNNRILQKYRVPEESKKGERAVAREMERESAGPVPKDFRLTCNTITPCSFSLNIILISGHHNT